MLVAKKDGGDRQLLGSFRRRGCVRGCRSHGSGASWAVVLMAAIVTPFSVEGREVEVKAGEGKEVEGRGGGEAVRVLKAWVPGAMPPICTASAGNVESR